MARTGFWQCNVLFGGGILFAALGLAGTRNAQQENAPARARASNPSESRAKAPDAPAPSGARILLLPRQVVAGERATLAVLDVNGRLTPNVTVNFSNGDQVTTDATGRAGFAAPLIPGVILASLANRTGHVAMTILRPEEAASEAIQVLRVPRITSLTDRFEVAGRDFCGGADANEVTIGGQKALTLAASPVSLTMLPPENLDPGNAAVQISCAKKQADPFLLLFVGLSLEADSSPIRPGEHRPLTVHVSGTTEKIWLEARNLAPEVAKLESASSDASSSVLSDAARGTAFARAQSNGGTGNAAHFVVIGKTNGSFLISIRLLAGSGPPRAR